MIKLKEILLKEDETDELKQILKQDYPTFVKKLGDSIKDPKFLAAIKSLSSEHPIKTSDITPNVRDLKPTQNEVVLANSLAFPLANVDSAEECLKGGVTAPKNESIVTAGGGKYVIDGHHRWSQVFCMNPDAKIKAVDMTEMKDPIKALKATQLGVAAKIGEVPSSPGGGVNLFTINEQTLKKYVIETITDDVIEVFKKYDKGSTKEEIANYIWENVKLLQTNATPVPNAPSRNVMPQTDDAKDFATTGVNVEKLPEIARRMKKVISVNKKGRW